MRQKPGEFELSIREMSGKSLDEIADKLGIKDKKGRNSKNNLRKRIESLAAEDISIIGNQVICYKPLESRPIPAARTDFGARNLRVGSDYLRHCEEHPEAHDNRLTGPEVTRLMSIDVHPPRRRV